MSAPQLPAAFGNYALGEQFTELAPPPPVGWWPQTAGWLFVAILLGAVLLFYIARKVRHWYRNRYRREALAELGKLAQAGSDAAWLTELNRLLKLTALAGYPRDRVAQLAGREWVDFLNEECPIPAFTGDQSALLAEDVYRAEILATQPRSELLSAASYWVQHHRGAARV